MISGADSIGEWIEAEHPAPVGARVEATGDPEVVAAYERAFDLYRERGRALFADA